jgi:hypothetical protein
MAGIRAMGRAIKMVLHAVEHARTAATHAQYALTANIVNISSRNTSMAAVDAMAQLMPETIGTARQA